MRTTNKKEEMSSTTQIINNETIYSKVSATTTDTLYYKTTTQNDNGDNKMKTERIETCEGLTVEIAVRREDLPLYERVLDLTAELCEELEIEPGEYNYYRIC